jgi:MFS/sugar transport protein
VAVQVTMAAFVIILLVTAMLSSVGWLWLSKRFGKFAAWQAFNFVNAATNLSFFLLGEGDSYLVLAAGALNGIPVGGQFLVNTIMSDVIDYDEFLNGSRSEGAFSVFATLIPKFVAIPSAAIPLALINLLGFKQPIAGVAQPQNDNVKRFIQVCFVMLPFSAAVLSFLLKFLYPIKRDSIAKEVQRGIEKFKKGHAENKVITVRFLHTVQWTSDCAVSTSIPSMERKCSGTVVLLLWHTQVRDPVLREPVQQRSFSAEDDKQAVLMEMYTEKQLYEYLAALEAVIQRRMALPKSDEGAHTCREQGTAHSQSVPVSLVRIIRRPVICCTYTLTDQPAVLLPCVGLSPHCWPEMVQRCCRWTAHNSACDIHGGIIPTAGQSDYLHRAYHVLHSVWLQPVPLWRCFLALVWCEGTTAIPGVPQALRQAARVGRPNPWWRRDARRPQRGGSLGRRH